MKELLDQYGKTVVTIVIVVIITGILAVLTVNGATGIIDIAGRGSNKLADGDTEIVESVSAGLLDSQADTPIPELQVAIHPIEGETLSVNKLLALTYNAGTVDIQPKVITTALNDNNSDAEQQGLATINGKNITFTRPATLFLTVDIRQENRLMTQIFKIVVDKMPEPVYGFAKVNGSWCYCKNEFDTNTRDFTKHTVIKKYPVSTTDIHGYQWGDPVLIWDSVQYSYDAGNDRLIKTVSSTTFLENYIDDHSSNLTILSQLSSTSYIPVSAINQSTGMP